MSDSEEIYGIRSILEAVESNQNISKIYLQKGLKGQLFKQLEHAIRKNKISSSYVPVEKLNQLTNNNHQGAIAKISPIALHDANELFEQIISTKKDPFFVLLDRISDVRNFGAIIRTAECSGVDAIVIPKSGAAPLNSDAIKTSAGAAFKVPITKVDHLKDAIYYLQGSGVRIVAATEKAEQSIYKTDFKGPVAVVMGSEDRGVSPSILKMVDDQAKLPLLGEIDSLNVSVACGIFLYEVVRQRMS